MAFSGTEFLGDKEPDDFTGFWELWAALPTALDNGRRSPERTSCAPSSLRLLRRTP